MIIPSIDLMDGKAVQLRQGRERVLTSDPGMGVVRHADAGYDLAIETAKRHGIKMPMLK